MSMTREERGKIRADAEAALRTQQKLSFDDLKQLVGKLQAADEFGHALSVLERNAPEGLSAAEERWVRQQRAHSMYKDTHQSAARRLARALQILDEGGELARSDDAETLGLAGAIYKRRFAVLQDKRDLETSLDYYERGHEADRAGGFSRGGYPGINAAFVLDQLAALERRGATAAAPRSAVAARGERAREIRRELVDRLPPDPTSVWRCLTLAEAHFGLGAYPQAETCAAAALDCEDKAPWILETATRQLVALARLQSDEVQRPEAFLESPPGKVVRALLGDDARAALSAVVGKVGLALSGGGFRASLYHIGVLARLAELGALRHVEVISCVSGGSIVGAYYYLELRELLESRGDAELSTQDYIELVERVQRGFLAGVQRNVRTRALSRFWTNLRMLVSESYSRTHRVGELYESEIYGNIARARGKEPPPEHFVGDCVIKPGEQADFHPRVHNWRRANKVPMLVLNATSLNTGHNWQFTGTYMGEPPIDEGGENDKNYRLRRVYYEETERPEHKRLRLGTAVGASACVPGLFEPIALEGLYRRNGEAGASAEDITVRLVDGGVHDNQGIYSLLEQDCNVLLVSDASGQMDADDNPSRGVLGVALRANGILQSRVRSAEFEDLVARERSGLVHDFMYVHLKLGLPLDDVDWVGCDEERGAASPADAKASLVELERNPVIPPRVQARLAAVRTDLDSFSDMEAYALMLSGYRWTERALPHCVPTLTAANATPHGWDFLCVQEKIDNEDATLMKVLEIAPQRAFKAFSLYPALKALKWLALLGLAVLGFWLYRKYESATLLTVQDVVGFLVGLATTFVVTALVGAWVMKVIKWRDTAMEFALNVAVALFGSLAAQVHLLVFDRLFLKYGALKPKAPAPDSSAVPTRPTAPSH